jgi:hypothetical protein
MLHPLAGAAAPDRVGETVARIGEIVGPGTRAVALEIGASRHESAASARAGVCHASSSVALAPPD